MENVYILWFCPDELVLERFGHAQGCFTTLKAARDAKTPYHRIYRGKLNEIWDPRFLTLVSDDEEA
jgi:hypothetical protein